MEKVNGSILKKKSKEKNKSENADEKV